MGLETGSRQQRRAPVLLLPKSPRRGPTDENPGSFVDLLAKNDENGEVPGSRPAKSMKNGVYVL